MNAAERSSRPGLMFTFGLSNKVVISDFDQHCFCEVMVVEARLGGCLQGDSQERSGNGDGEC